MFGLSHKVMGIDIKELGDAVQQGEKVKAKGYEDKLRKN